MLFARFERVHETREVATGGDRRDEAIAFAFDLRDLGLELLPSRVWRLPAERSAQLLDALLKDLAARPGTAAQAGKLAAD